MLSSWIVEVIQRFDGRTLAGQLTSSQRKQIDRLKKIKDLQPSEKQMRNLLTSGLKLHNSNIDDAETNRLWEAQNTATGPLSSFFIALRGNLSTEGLELIALAKQLDSISSILNQLKYENEITAFKEILLNSNDYALSECYWLCPWTDADMRAELQIASDWTAIDGVIVRLRHNCILSFAALWDIFYANAAFPKFQLSPLFLFLAPRPKPGISLNALSEAYKLEPNRRFRPGDVLDMPRSLLLDLMYCLATIPHEKQNWENIDRLRGIQNRFENDQKKFEDIKYGRRPFTANQFAAWWVKL